MREIVASSMERGDLRALETLVERWSARAQSIASRNLLRSARLWQEAAIFAANEADVIRHIILQRPFEQALATATAEMTAHFMLVAADRVREIGAWSDGEGKVIFWAEQRAKKSA